MEGSVAQAASRPRIYPTFRGFLGFDYRVIFDGGLDGGLDGRFGWAIWMAVWMGDLDRQFGHITRANLRLSDVLV